MAIDTRDLDMANEIEGRDALWNMFHKQGDTVNSLSQGLAETRAEVKGLGGQLKDFQEHVLTAIENISKPKPSQLWQIVAVCLTILTMFGIVMLYTVANAKEVGQLKFEAASAADEAMRRETDLRFKSNALTDASMDRAINWASSRMDKTDERALTAIYEGGKQNQKLEDLNMFARRMDVELQSRFLAGESRLTGTEIETARTAAIAKILAEVQRLNSERILNQ